MDSKTTKAKQDLTKFTKKGKVRKRFSRKHDGFYPTKLEVKSGTCGDCGLVAKDRDKLIEHKAHYHDKTNYDCEICGRIVKGKRKLKSHLNGHKQTFKGKVECPMCGKKVNKLPDHMNTMHKDRQYSCDLCEKKFVSEAILKRHTVVHFDIKPFVCRFGCGHSTKCSGNRTKHEIHKHGAKSELDTKAMIESGELMIGEDS